MLGNFITACFSLEIVLPYSFPRGYTILHSYHQCIYNVPRDAGGKLFKPDFVYYISLLHFYCI